MTRVWDRQPSYTWTDAALRLIVDSFLDGFVAEHGWARAANVRESFAVAPTDLNVYPNQPLQRAGTPILVFTVTRERDSQHFEVALPFPEGAETDRATTDRMLRAARESIRELEKLAR